MFARFAAVFVLAAPFLAPAALHAQEAPPLSAYGELPDIEDVAISPTGNHVAMAASIDGERRVVILNSSLEPLRVINTEDIKFRGVRFVGDEAILVDQTQTEAVRGFVADRYELNYVTVVPIAGSEPARPIFNGERSLATAVFGNYGIRQVEDEWRGYFGAIEYNRNSRGDYVFNYGSPALYQVTFDGLRNQRVSSAAEERSYRNWLIGADGEIAARFDISRSSGTWTIRNSAGDSIAEGRNENGDAGLVGLGYDGNTLIYSQEDPESGLTDWYEVALAGGQPQLFLDGVEISRLYRDPATGRLIGYRERSGANRYTFRDPAIQERVDQVRAAFSGYQMSLRGWSSDMSKVIVYITGNQDSGTWLLVDVNNLSAQAIGYDRPDLPPPMVGRTSMIDYVAQDGLEMNGVLTLPLGMETGADLPVIVLPHGGPHSRDGLGFDWWAQAFSSRGYAVFQPNFRGSTGRGEEFMLAGYGEWGRKMQTDISDGVAHLAELGIVDPSRACIVGASYGGYAALAGVTLQQGLYRCAVSVNGVADLPTMYSDELREASRSRLTRASLREEFGPLDRWDSISPRRQAERADAPILLIHGRDDTVVLFEQSRLMADALDDADKPHRLITLDGEDHWLSSPETRQQMLRATMQFVLEHNPPD